MCVNISNKAVYAQIIDDDKKTTLLTVNSLNLDNGKQNLTQLASAVGTEVGKKAKAKKIKRVSFDRGAKLYHGRIKALAESARKEGLEF